MAVAFDAKATVFTGVATTSFTNASHTVGALANAWIALMQFGGDPGTVTTLQWDSTGTPQTITLVGSKAASDSSSFAYVYGLLAPHTGLKTFKLVWTNSVSYAGITFSVTGADQTSFATTFKNLATNASNNSASGGNYPTPSGLAITTNAGDMAVMSSASANESFATGGGLGTQLGFINTNVSGDQRYLVAVGTSTSVAANSSVFTASPCCAAACAITAGLLGQICI